MLPSGDLVNAQTLGVASAVVVGFALGAPLARIGRLSLRTDARLGWRATLTMMVFEGVAFGLLSGGGAINLRLLVALSLAAAAGPLALVDMVEKRLPNHLVLATAIAVTTALVAGTVLRPTFNAPVAALLGAASMFAIYLLLALVAPGGLGMGDVKLAAVLGLATASVGWRTWLIALLAGILINGVASIAALVLRRVTLRGSIPFGPSMLAGALLALLLT